MQKIYLIKDWHCGMGTVEIQRQGLAIDECFESATFMVYITTKYLASSGFTINLVVIHGMYKIIDILYNIIY